MPNAETDHSRSYPSRRSLREADHPTPAQTQTSSIRLPRVPHVPSDPADYQPAATTRRTPQRRFAAFSAATGVCGLVLAFALPLTSQADDTVAAAAGQQLFSEVSASDMPDSFADVGAIASEEVTEASYSFNPKVLVNYPFAKPVTLTDVFGYRTAPVEQFHDAQDFAASEGTPIQVIADGVVTEAGFAPDGCGFGLKVEHEIDGKEVTSRYCHMSNDSHNWQEGDTVDMGDEAGLVGATGMAFGAHLHLAIVVDDVPTDPMPFLAKYNTMLRDDAQKHPDTDIPTTPNAQDD